MTDNERIAENMRKLREYAIAADVANFNRELEKQKGIVAGMEDASDLKKVIHHLLENNQELFTLLAESQSKLKREVMNLNKSSQNKMSYDLYK